MTSIMVAKFCKANYPIKSQRQICAQIVYYVTLATRKQEGHEKRK